MASPYENIIALMRLQGAALNTAEIQIGVMTGKTSLEIGELKLTKSELLFNELLLHPILTKLDIKIESSGGTTHTHSWTDKSKYLEPLKKGDVVAVQRISDSLYVVLGKLVEA